MSVTLCFVGCWLVIAPFTWTYGTSHGLDARWNDGVIGALVLFVGLGRLVGRVRLVSATLVPVLAGLWLLLAPFMLGHGFGADSTRATVVDLVAGVVVIAVAVAGYVNARRRLRTEPATRRA
ncbi:SPW repeat protein [Actinophytocola sp. NPDC049390]|uniref:SPW repeat domain-containing protein n=1 Tax=Actinophytocola sp. NPDC049390 TaxID=3363894 RepID=UPI0037AB73E5